MTTSGEMQRKRGGPTDTITPLSTHHQLFLGEKIEGAPRGLAGLLVDVAHIGVSLKHKTLQEPNAKICIITARGPQQTATKLHCCDTATRFGLWSRS